MLLHLSRQASRSASETQFHIATPQQRDRVQVHLRLLLQVIWQRLEADVQDPYNQQDV